MFTQQLRAAAFCVAVAVAAQSARADDYANPHLIVTADALAAELVKSSPGTGKKLKLVILDVRPKADYVRGHIPGARRLDPDAVADPDAPVGGALKSLETLSSMFGEMGISSRTRVVLYDGRGGFHAARVFWLLEYLGHRNASLLDGGIQSWKRGGKEIRTGREKKWKRPKVRFAIAVAPRRHATADWILERRGNPETTVVDVRPGKLFAKGHIPWARNIPWSRNLKADLTMRPAGELLAHFKENGVTPDRNIVVHCQNGLASAHSYFALRLLGYPRVRTYHRSWAEWGTSDDLPKAFAAPG